MKSDERYRRFIGEYCAVLALDVAEVLSTRRDTRSVVRARQVLTYVLRRRFELSYPELGRLLGRDHTTCMHSDRKVARALADGASWAVELIEQSKQLDNLSCLSALDALRRCGRTIELATEAVG